MSNPEPRNTESQTRAQATPANAAAASEDEGAPKPPRSVALIFTQSTLLLEAVAAFCAVLATWGLQRVGQADISSGLLWGGGAALVLLLAWAAGQQKKRWGRWLGSALQVPMLVAGIVVPTIAVIGVVFLVIWLTAVRLGTRLDRERAERDAAAAAPGE